jgi:HSP20 family molecular chaperone IbpA
MASRDVEDKLADSIQQAVTASSHPVTVPVNMYEADEAYVVIAPLPGVMADDIEVKIVDGNTLSIYAEMRSPAIKAYLMHEWTYGPYERTVDIPVDCTGEIETSFGNGQLAVRILRN